MSLEIRNFYPDDGAGGISINSDIIFDLVALDGSTIDISTISVTIETLSNIDAATHTISYTISDTTELKYTGDNLHYKVEVNPDRPFDVAQSVTVKVNVDDGSGTSMDEYESSFTTVRNGILTDFRYTILESVDSIPVYYEMLRGNNSTAPTYFHSAFNNWNEKPSVVVRKNDLIIDSGFTIDYQNGIVYFDSALDYNDKISVDYTFKFFSDEQISRYFQQATSVWKMNPPAGGPSTIYAASSSFQPVFFVGAAVYAFRDLLLSLAIQEKRIIFDNESWEEGWKQIKDLFKGLSEEYKTDWEKLLEAKKFGLPNIAAVVTPSYTLPGGRTLAFFGLCELENGDCVNFEDIFNMMLDKKDVKILSSKGNKLSYNKVSCIEFEGKKNVYCTQLSSGSGCNMKTRLTATSLDHKFDTLHGMKRLKDISIGEKVFINRNNSLDIATVEEIGYIGREKCFEIEVPSSGKFMCNNVSVSNSRFFRYIYQ